MYSWKQRKKCLFLERIEKRYNKLKDETLELDSQISKVTRYLLFNERKEYIDQLMKKHSKLDCSEDFDLDPTVTKVE